MRFCFWLLFTSALLAQEKKKETLVVTGSYEAIPLEEAERSVRAIPAKELTPLASSIVDYLHLDAALDLRGRAPNGVNSGLSIRGGSFGQTLVLWNGLRLNSVQSSNLSMDLPIPLEAMTQIEVLKGSGSTLYGSDATAGVLNVITSPPEKSEIRLRSGFGNWGTQQQHASLAYVHRLFSEHLTFARDFSTGFAPNRDYRNLSLASETQFKSTSITLALNDRPYGADQFYGNYNSWERTKSWFAAIRQRIDRKTEASFAYRRASDLFVLYRDRPQVSTNRHVSETYQGSLRRTDGHFHYGAELLADRIDSNNLGHHSRARSAVYAAYDIRALKRFSFTAGIRDEIYRNFQHEWNPSVALGYWATDRLKFRASASRAFRLPTYTDLFYRDPANIGNALLRPERAWTYEGGLDLRLLSRTQVAVTVFQRRERDGIDFVRTTTTEPWRAINFQALNFTGLESLVTTRLGHHKFDLSYSTLHGAQDVLDNLQSKYVFNYPRQSGVASWQWFSNSGLLLRSRIGAMERFQRDPYAVWDLYASWQHGRVRPYLQFANLTSTRYQEFAGIAMPGRSVIGGIELVLLNR
ncbi:TonB-dependent receptor plug domain-containing protein [Bryobacter aggregatus]|uniref:TonB-dependent receptor plug domain-containing protein n=1 Tax=Bryobacter aggregatus TaxID=360054 RepID=UPI0004E1931B|nr:TonB-dependent receptor [Bryobacter aggregatus]